MSRLATLESCGKCIRSPLRTEEIAGRDYQLSATAEDISEADSAIRCSKSASNLPLPALHRALTMVARKEAGVVGCGERVGGEYVGVNEVTCNDREK